MASTRQDPQWTDYLRESAVAKGSLRTWKKAGEQLLIGRDNDGRIFALDNRCPHEGYPLAQGDLKDATLTCCWHNWKFDVHNGDCLRGGEGVRHYPLRVQHGMVQIDLAPPPVHAERQRLRVSLAQALSDADLDRALRDGIRLLRTNYPLEHLLGDVALHDADHAEYGATHTLALAAETRQLLAYAGDTPAAYMLAPLMELAGESNQRLERRRRPQPVSGAQLDSVRQAVEREDLETAEAAVLGAYADGRSRAEIENWLFHVCADHFLSFGHGLIYLIKTRALLDVLPHDYAGPIHASLLFYMGNATREDTLPYLRSYFVPVQEWAKAFASIPRWSTGAQEHGEPPQYVETAVLDGKRAEAMQSVWDALQQGYTPAQIAQALVLAASRRLLRFDLQVDADPAVQEGWLFATHRLTFASATRVALERFDSPLALHFLFQAAAFLHSGAPMDAATPAYEELPQAVPATAQQLRKSVLGHAADLALRQVIGLLAGGDTALGNKDELLKVLHQCALDANLVRPIFRVHAIKTLLAAVEEAQALGTHHRRSLPLLAAVRFLAAHIHEGRSHSAAHAASEWVEHGRMIRKLTQ